jgi:tripartite-type tricarboxylate transporter receptor subunit TctC
MLQGRRTFLGAAAASVLVPRLASAQEGQQRIVVPFSAGSGTDITARVIAETIGKNTGRTVIVENRGGAGGSIGAAEVARARPDGNTVLYTTGGFTTNAALFKSLPFDPIADFTPITLLTRSSGFVLLVSEKSPFKTLDQFVTAARKEPGRLTFGSSGVGNTTHVMGVLFCKGVGVDLLHIPFKGTPSTELIGGTVDSAFISPATVAQQIRAGQLRGLGISGPTRSALLPDTPTFAEAGLQVEDIPAWSGVWGPAKMPPDVLRAVYERLAKAAQTPSLVNYTRENGGELVAMPPEPFKAFVTSEIERYRRVLPPLGIQLG